MSAAAVVTLIIVGVIVVALAAFLLWVVAMLRRINDTLGKVTFGVRAIAHRVEPVGPVVAEINGDLTAVAGALEHLAAKVAPARASSATAI
jgi:hypothetical protein